MWACEDVCAEVVNKAYFGVGSSGGFCVGFDARLAFETSVFSVMERL